MTKEERQAQRKEDRAQRAQDFKNQKVNDVKDFNYDQHNRKGVKGTHISGQEVKHVREAGGRDAAYASLKAQKEAGATFGDRAQKKFDRMERRIEKSDARKAAKEKSKAVKEQPGPDNQIQPYNPPGQSSDPEYNPSSQPSNQQVATNTGDIDQTTKITNTQEQDVTQDNDIDTTVNGNNNTVVNNQDNSVRQFGGDNRSMVINEANTGNQSGSGSNGAYYNAADKAISMATLGGFYDVDDSPAARAAFVDQSVTMNNDNQKRYAGMGLATAAQFSNFDPGTIDRAALDQSIRGDEQKWFDRAKVQEVNTYGDRAAVKNYPKFEFGDPIEEITSNAGKIADGYKDDIDDM